MWRKLISENNEEVTLIWAINEEASLRGNTSGHVNGVHESYLGFPEGGFKFLYGADARQQ